METAKGLYEILKLEKENDLHYVGQNYQTIWKRVYGGQVLAQSLHAAYQTVPEDRFVHSLHGYFILAGDIKTAIDYKVEHLRDGGSFTTRHASVLLYNRSLFLCLQLR